MAIGYKTIGSGRKEGSLNIVTRAMKEKLSQVAFYHIENVLNPSDLEASRFSAEVLKIILPYIVPKMSQSVELESPVVISIHENI
jgi:hypothetical protein